MYDYSEHNGIIQQGNVNYGNNNGNIYNHCSFNGDEKRLDRDPHDMYEEKTALHLGVRWLAAVISVIAEIVSILVAIIPNDESESVIGRTIGYLINGMLNGTIMIDQFLAKLAIEIVIACIVLLTTVYLCVSTLGLTMKYRYGNLRRYGMKVFRVIPNRCPICNAKMKLIYQGGNCFECTQNKNQHRWAVDFPIK